MSEQHRYSREELESLGLEELRTILARQVGGTVIILGLTLKARKQNAVNDILRFQDEG